MSMTATATPAKRATLEPPTRAQLEEMVRASELARAEGRLIPAHELSERLRAAHGL